MRKKQIEKEVPNKMVVKEKDAKDIAVEVLLSHGYDAFLQDGVVFCKNITETTYKEMTEILKKIGYKSSYGVISTGEIKQTDVVQQKPKKEIKQVGRDVDPRLQKLWDKGENVYSISRIDTINDCLYSAYRTYILNEKGHGNVYSCAGSVIHEILEKITNGEATEKDLLPGVKAELDNLEALGIEFPKDRNEGDSIKVNWITNMEHFCKTYIAPKGKKLKTEELFLYTTPKGYHFQGYIDLQQEFKNGSIAIYDYKSSSMYKGEDLKSHARQLILYALGKEQEGIKVRSANWVFLKYCTIKFMGKKTAKSKEKTEIIKHIERRKLGQELEGYLYADMIEAGYDEMDIEIILDKYKKTNIMKGSIPDKIAEKYTIRPCVISVDLDQESKDECIQYLEDTVEKWEALNPKNEFDYLPKSFTKIQKDGKEVKDTFFCHQLCNHGHVCPYLKDFEDQWKNENENDDLF